MAKPLTVFQEAVAESLMLDFGKEWVEAANAVSLATEEGRLPGRSAQAVAEWILSESRFWVDSYTEVR
jgi:hypothetical protein